MYKFLYDKQFNLYFMYSRGLQLTSMHHNLIWMTILVWTPPPVLNFIKIHCVVSKIKHMDGQRQPSHYAIILYTPCEECINCQNKRLENIWGIKFLPAWLIRID